MIKVKPITSQVPQLSKKLIDLVYADLPINKWCKEQELKRKNKKF